MNKGRPMQSSPSRRFALVLLLGMTALVPLLSGCGSSSSTASNVPTGPVEELYNNGVDALNARRFSTADDQFNAVQQNYPYSSWAVNAQLMSGYSEYLQNKYTDAIGTLDRFIQLHPVHRDIAYAYYLRALCYYEQIADIERDQKGTEQAMNALREVVTRFPDTSYATDAKLKIDLCIDHLAGKEMEIGRYYQKHDQYVGAINRYRTVIERYQTTTHVPEALHRLVECYMALGVKSEAKEAAAVLGHNFPGSDWYADSYFLITGEDYRIDAK